MVENRDRDRLIAKPCLAFSRDNEFLESLFLSYKKIETRQHFFREIKGDFSFFFFFSFLKKTGLGWEKSAIKRR